MLAKSVAVTPTTREKVQSRVIKDQNVFFFNGRLFDLHFQSLILAAGQGSDFAFSDRWVRGRRKTGI